MFRLFPKYLLLVAIFLFFSAEKPAEAGFNRHPHDPKGLFRGGEDRTDSRLRGNDSQVLDYILTNGKVYDGKSISPQKLDIGIKGDRIVALGDLSERKAGEVIDLKGLIVQPGIIDAHTHSDFTAFRNADFEHALRQGITTIVTGNCGMGAFPITPKNAKWTRETWLREGVEMPKGFLSADFSVYENLISRKTPRVNLAPLTAHGNLRNEAMGLAARTASKGEIRSETELLSQNLDEGAFGISFGLPYLPGIYADKDELLALATAAHKKDAVVTVHLASEGYELEKSVDTVLDLAQRSKATFIISHFKAAGTANWDKFFPALEKIAEARQGGLSVYITVYPYTAAQTELGSLLPSWFYEDPKRGELLKDGKVLERLKGELKKKKFDPARLIIAGVGPAGYREWEGKTVGDFARSRGLSDTEGAFTLLQETDFQVTVFAFGQHPYLVREALKQSFSIPVSDTIAELSDHPHPRAHGSFPVYFHDIALDSSALPLGEAVRKATSLPAEVYRIRDRGEIKVGAFADIAVWDPTLYQGTTSYSSSKVYAEGVKYLFVNGAPVIRDFKLTEVRSGRVLSRKKIEGSDPRV